MRYDNRIRPPIDMQTPSQKLRRADLNPDPFAQFALWLSEAHAADLPEANAMCLASVDAEGAPWQRTVLLKGCDADGLTFFTNYTSRKARHLAENAQVSVLFPWYALRRQAAVQGAVKKIGIDESNAYFATRPRASQLGAWASRQSSVLQDRTQLESRMQKIEKRYQGAPVAPPDFWGGYRITPIRFEFWQGRENRLHDRFVYQKTAQGWEITRLSP